jgi:hypothetical protein
MFTLRKLRSNGAFQDREFFTCFLLHRLTQRVVNPHRGSTFRTPVDDSSLNGPGVRSPDAV